MTKDDIVIEAHDGYCSRSYAFKCENYEKRCEEVCKDCPYWVEG